MKKEMIDLLKKKNKISNKNADDILEIEEEEIVEFLKEIGLQEGNITNLKNIKENLNTKYIGKNIYYYDEVKSTNNIAKFLGEEDEEEGTVIIADKQTKARGRSGKPWKSPKGGSWLSILIRPNVPPTHASLITLAAGVAVCKTLRRLGVKSEIKWPNDILIGGKKVSGILTEAKATFNNLDYVVVGIGIDTNLNIEDFPEELQKGVTSLKNEADREIQEAKLIDIFLEEFEEVYNLFKEEKYEKILNKWRLLSKTIGSEVIIKQPLGKIIEGYAIGINKEGSLIIEKNDGTLEKIFAGELRHKDSLY
jgi:BirA family biotin operon repressor/biotin-[acetyl-CoA-carboxylase] ligase